MPDTQPLIEVVELLADESIKHWHFRSRMAQINFKSFVAGEISSELIEQVKRDASSLAVDFLRHPDSPRLFMNALRTPFHECLKKSEDRVNKLPRASQWFGFWNDVVDKTREKDAATEVMRRLYDELNGLSEKRDSDSRMLHGLEGEPDDIQAETILKYFGQWAQNYEVVIHALFDLSRLGTPTKDPNTFGNRSKQTESLLQERYPKYVGLLDTRVVHVRNAIRGHDKFEVDAVKKQITLWDSNARGTEKYRETLNFDEPPNRLQALLGDIEASTCAAELVNARTAVDFLGQYSHDLERIVAALRVAVLRGVDDGDWSSFNSMKELVSRRLLDNSET